MDMSSHDPRWVVAAGEGGQLGDLVLTSCGSPTDQTSTGERFNNPREGRGRKGKPSTAGSVALAQAWEVFHMFSTLHPCLDLHILPGLS